MTRAVTSTFPPGAYGTTMVMGLAGNRCATDGCVSTARQKKMLRIERKPPIVSLLDFLVAAVHPGEASSGDCRSRMSPHCIDQRRHRHGGPPLPSYAHPRAARTGVPLCC